MNKIDFTQTGGFPFDQSTLDFLQDSILLAGQLATAIGDRAILSGCIVAGSNAGNGYMVIDGEILPFTGGVIEDKVIIIEADNDLTYEDGTPRPVVKTRYATFGDDGVTDILWSDFRSNRLDRVWLTGDIKEVDCSYDYFMANFDGTGLGINEREGWAICNGQNDTKDRRGLMSIQFDPTKPYADTLGKTGGEEKHILTLDELPSDPVPYTAPKFGLDFGSGTTRGSWTDQETDNLVLGSGHAHNNMSPYIVTLVIQKL